MYVKLASNETWSRPHFRSCLQYSVSQLDYGSVAFLTTNPCFYQLDDAFTRRVTCRFHWRITGLAINQRERKRMGTRSLLCYRYRRSSQWGKRYECSLEKRDNLLRKSRGNANFTFSRTSIIRLDDPDIFHCHLLYLPFNSSSPPLETLALLIF